MSRLRLAAGCAVLKLAQEPCYYEIITLEQFQLCALVMNVSDFYLSLNVISIFGSCLGTFIALDFQI